MSQSRLGHRSNKVLRRQVSERAELQPLCEDLKFFYVALTRARRRVIIFDDSDKRMPLFEMLGRRGLANAARVEDLSAPPVVAAPSPMQAEAGKSGKRVLCSWLRKHTKLSLR